MHNVLDLRSDAVIGALLLAYSGALAPYVLLADVQSQIRVTIKTAQDEVERSAQKLSEGANASLVQSIRAAKEERRRLEDEADRLSKNLIDQLRAGGESAIAAVKADVTEQVLHNAQDEFVSARTQASRDVRVWATLTAAVLLGLLLSGWYLLKSQETLFVAHPAWTWQFIYIAGLRLALLAVLAALASFSLRMLKQHIQIKHAVAYKCCILKSVPGLLIASPQDNRYSTLQVVISALLSERELVPGDNNPESISLAMPKIPDAKSRGGGAA